MAKEKKSMGKFKNSYLAFTLLLVLSVLGQNKEVTPKKGIISFKKTEIITDSLIYKKSKRDLVIEMFKFNAKNLSDDADSIAVNNMIQEIADNFDMFDEPLEKINKSIKSVNMIFYSDSIDYYWTEDNNLIGFHNIINIKDFPEPQAKFKTSVQKFIQQEYNVYGDRKEYNFYFSNNQILEIKEFREEIKTIKGYICFRVIYTYLENGLDTGDDFTNFMKKYPNTRELWVTDRIKTLFHPVITDKEILQKYYPLEIKEYLETAKGIEMYYELENISLSN